MPKRPNILRIQDAVHEGYPYWLYVGIDPGASGGIALIHTPENKCKCVKMPTTERDIWDWFMELKVLCMELNLPCRAMIERVHAMPKQGVSSTFKFGMGYGGIRMALVAAEIPFETVTPHTWQKGLAIPQKKGTETGVQWKNRLKAKAQELFPDVSVTLATADAILIAEYHKRSYR